MTQTSSSDEDALPTSSGVECPACQGRFMCELVQGCATCWCMKLPACLPVSANARCLCPECLKQAIGTLIENSAGKTNSGE